MHLSCCLKHESVKCGIIGGHQGVEVRRQVEFLTVARIGYDVAHHLTIGPAPLKAIFDEVLERLVNTGQHMALNVLRQGSQIEFGSIAPSPHCDTQGGEWGPR